MLLINKLHIKTQKVCSISHNFLGYFIIFCRFVFDLSDYSLSLHKKLGKK